MTIDDLRRQAEVVIRATHRRASDGAQATRVTIFQRDMFNDLVRIEYGDGEVRDFRRVRPVATDDAASADGGRPESTDTSSPRST